MCDCSLVCIKKVAFFALTYNPKTGCVGPDSNRRTPARRDPKSRSFDLTRIPTLSKMVLTDFYAKERFCNVMIILAWLLHRCGENMSVSSVFSGGLRKFAALLWYYTGRIIHEGVCQKIMAYSLQGDWMGKCPWLQFHSGYDTVNLIWRQLVELDHGRG